MSLDDSFANLPLFGIAALSFILIVLVSVIKKKGSARVSSIMYLSLLILLLSSLAGAVAKMGEDGETVGNGFIIFGTSSQPSCSFPTASC